jgi:hypothetical protein
MHDHLKHLFDGLSIGAAFGSLFGALPHIAALASLVWTVIRIYETSTVQGWLKRRGSKA